MLPDCTGQCCSIALFGSLDLRFVVQPSNAQGHSKGFPAPSDQRSVGNGLE
jgi:hypothetical protein